MSGPRLIDLRTDLKSLRYGSDKPYITKDINNPPSSNLTGMQITKRVDDLSRITQMLVDRPGLKFLGNQALLQQVNLQDKLQKSRDNGKTLGGAILQQALGTVKQTAKIVGSTLAQVPVNGTGTHFVYGFRTDTYLQPTGGNNRSAFAQFFGAGGVEGAPLALRGKEITGEISSNFPKGDKQQTTPDFQTYSNTSSYAQSIKEPGEVDKVFTSSSIEGSIDKRNVSGSGFSFKDNDIKSKYSNSASYTGNTTEETVLGASTGSIILKNATTPISEITNSVPISGSEVGQDIVSSENFNTQVVDFRKEQGKSYSFDYSNSKINKEKRVNLGNQGKVTFDRSKYSNTDLDTKDKLNLLDISDTRIDGTSNARDLAKMYFEIITPDGSKFLHFRAFIDSVDDNYNADWQGSKYVGRAESFYTYGGFERDVSISFKIAAATRAEMKPLYRKMVYLASSTAPTYGGQGFMRGTLARLTVGSYFSQLPGVITSVKYNLIDGMPWEISMQSPEQGGDSDVQELPMGLQCSVSFKVIHDFAPQTGLYHYFTNPNPVNAQDFLK